MQTAIDAFDNILHRIFDKRREYAPSTACYILNLNPTTFEPLDGCSADRREIWFDNLMPEVRGRLIYLLIASQDRSGKSKSDIYRDEALQRQPIISIIKWHSSIDKTKKRQYIETLERINDSGEKIVLDYSLSKSEDFRKKMKIKKCAMKEHLMVMS